MKLETPIWSCKRHSDVEIIAVLRLAFLLGPSNSPLFSVLCPFYVYLLHLSFLPTPPPFLSKLNICVNYKNLINFVLKTLLFRDRLTTLLLNAVGDVTFPLQMCDLFFFLLKMRVLRKEKYCKKKKIPTSWLSISCKFFCKISFGLKN